MFGQEKDGAVVVVVVVDVDEKFVRTVVVGVVVANTVDVVEVSKEVGAIVVDTVVTFATHGPATAPLANTVDKNDWVLPAHVSATDTRALIVC